MWVETHFMYIFVGLTLIFDVKKNYLRKIFLIFLDYSLTMFLSKNYIQNNNNMIDQKIIKNTKSSFLLFVSLVLLSDYHLRVYHIIFLIFVVLCQ